MTGNLISTDTYQTEGVQSKEIQLFSDQDISLYGINGAYPSTVCIYKDITLFGNCH